jgi:hypothetical protein
MHSQKRGLLFVTLSLAVLLNLPGCGSLGAQRFKERVAKCYQPRDAELADWPERLEDFPVAGLQWLAVIREERKLTKIERDCVKKL